MYRLPPTTTLMSQNWSKCLNKRYCFTSTYAPHWKPQWWYHITKLLRIMLSLTYNYRVDTTAVAFWWLYNLRLHPYVAIITSTICSSYFFSCYLLSRKWSDEISDITDTTGKKCHEAPFAYTPAHWLVYSTVVVIVICAGCSFQMTRLKCKYDD